MILLSNSRMLRKMAYEMLDGHGDISRGEWIEDRPAAFHLRRRLSESEQEQIGQALDCRSTTEGRLRLEAIRNMLPAQALYLANAELAGTDV